MPRRNAGVPGIGWVGPTLVLVALGVISTVAALFTRETAPVKVGTAATRAVDA